VGLLTPDLVERGLSAGELLGPAASRLGGGGSRDPELAQAGGPKGEALESALETARTELSRTLADL
jgi:alanyl-tRNA synthetase